MSGNPFDLVGKQRRRSREQAEAGLLNQQELADLAWLMADDRGRRVMRRLLEQLGLWSDIFDQNAVLMGKKASKRDFAVHLLDDLEDISPDHAIQMLQERLQDQRRSADERRNDTQS